MCKSGKDLDKIPQFFFLWLILVSGFALCVYWHCHCLQAPSTSLQLFRLDFECQTSCISHAPIKGSAFWKQEVLTKCLLRERKMICALWNAPAILIRVSVLVLCIISSRTASPWSPGVGVPAELGPSTMKVVWTDGQTHSQQSVPECESRAHRWEWPNVCLCCG